MDEIASYILIFALDIVVSAFFLWLGAKVVGWYTGMLDISYCTFKEFCIVVLVCSLLSFIPSIGWLLSIIAGIFLIMKFSQANILEVIFIILASRLMALLVSLFLIPILATA